MKIAFIVTGPNYLQKDNLFPHLGIGYMISILEKKGHDCLYLDASLDSLDALYEYRPEIVGISVTSAAFDQAMVIAHGIKKIWSPIIILGGAHVNIALGNVLLDPVIDYAIYGEGELSISELIDAFDHKTLDKLSEITGLIYRKDGEVTVNLPRPWIEKLDELPYPAYNHFIKYHYSNYPLLTNRGCPHQCVYCTINTTWGRKVRSRTADNILKEIEYILTHYEKKPFIILDDTFNINITRCKEFCNLLIDKNLNIQWSCWSFRADNVDEELANLMKKSGCRYVSVGVESADPIVLKQIKKGETIEDITKGIHYLQKAGIIVHGNFMIGNIGDTLDSIKKSILYARKQKLDDFDFYLARPYPGTELWNCVEKEGRFINKDFTKFDHFSKTPVFDTVTFSREDRKKALILAMRAKAANRIVRRLTRKYTISDLARFTSRHINRLFGN